MPPHGAALQSQVLRKIVEKPGKLGASMIASLLGAGVAEVQQAIDTLRHLERVEPSGAYRYVQLEPTALGRAAVRGKDPNAAPEPVEPPRERRENPSAKPPTMRMELAVEASPVEPEPAPAPKPSGGAGASPSPGPSPFEVAGVQPSKVTSGPPAPEPIPDRLAFLSKVAGGRPLPESVREYTALLELVEAQQGVLGSDMPALLGMSASRVATIRRVLGRHGLLVRTGTTFRTRWYTSTEHVPSEQAEDLRPPPAPRRGPPRDGGEAVAIELPSGFLSSARDAGEETLRGWLAAAEGTLGEAQRELTKAREVLERAREALADAEQDVAVAETEVGLATLARDALRAALG